MTYATLLASRCRSHPARFVIAALITVGSGAASAVPLAPVGHRQPTAVDIRGIDPFFGTKAAESGRRIRVNRGDKDLNEGTPRICTNCDV